MSALLSDFEFVWPIVVIVDQVIVESRLIDEVIVHPLYLLGLDAGLRAYALQLGRLLVPHEK